MTVLGALQEVRNRISKPEHWAKGTMARDKDNDPVCCPRSRRAAQWSICGAINYAIDSVETERHIKKVLVAHLPSQFKAIDLFNDHPRTTHQDVLDLLDRAIEVEKQ